MREATEAADGVVVLVWVARDGLEVLGHVLRRLPRRTHQAIRLSQIDVKLIGNDVFRVGQGQGDEKPFDRHINVVLIGCCVVDRSGECLFSIEHTTMHLLSRF